MRTRSSPRLLASLALCLVALVFPLWLPAPIHAQTPAAPAGAPTHAIVSARGALGAAASEPAPIEELDWKTQLTLAADGSARVLIEHHIRNTGTDALARHGLRFNFGSDPARYSAFSASDAQGKLAHALTNTDEGVLLEALFRAPLAPAEETTYFLGITIANVATQEGDARTFYVQAASAHVLHNFVFGITFPLNAQFDAIAPAPEARQGAYLEWQRSASDSGVLLEVSVDYTLSNQIVVPLFWQTDARWGGDEYYSYPDTIARIGCNLTSVAMAVNYYRALAGATTTVDPGDYNAWLKQQGFTNSGAAQLAADTYARARGFDLYFPLPGYLINHADDATVDASLRSGNPVELRVNSATSPTGIHFVLAVGIEEVNGVKTYTINDPAYGKTTLLRRYNNEYTMLMPFSATPGTLEKLVVAVRAGDDALRAQASGQVAAAPADLLVVDPQGRRFGRDGAGGLFAEIPGAQYLVQTMAALDGSGAHEERLLLVPEPLDGAYTVQIAGTARGDYAADIVTSSWSGDLQVRNVTGTARPGAQQRTTVTYASDFRALDNALFLPVVQR